MDFDEEALIAEAIRRSLADSQPEVRGESSSASLSAMARTTALQSKAPPQAPSIIDLTDEIEPVKMEQNTISSMNLSRDAQDAATTAEQEDRDLKLALALSMADAASPYSIESEPVSMATALTSSSQGISRQKESITSKTTFSLGSLNRAEMEHERQERIKRKAMNSAGVTVQPQLQTEHRAKKSRSQTVVSNIFSTPELPELSVSTSSSSVSPSTKRKVPFPSTSSSSKVSAAALPSVKSSSPLVPKVPVPTSGSSTPYTTPSILPSRAEMIASIDNDCNKGSVRDDDEVAAVYPPKYNVATFRNTWIKGARPGQAIRFQELVDKNFLVKAVLTTFELDEEWLEHYLPRTIPQCLVHHWSREHGDKPGFLTDGKVTYLHPPLNGFGSFHPKLMLLFYPTFCRVVISSANLVAHDWIVLVNTVYVQDFLLLPKAVERPEEMGDFGSTLYNFLKVMTVPEKVLAVVRAVDFSGAKVLLVPSVQGSFPVGDDYTYGIAQLANVMRKKTSPNQEMEMEYQTSSIGKLSHKFLSEFYDASRGRPVKPRSKVYVEERLPDIKVVFPTEKHVQNSRYGELGAGTVCFHPQAWDDPTFPRRVMHDFECVGPYHGSLMHSKFVLAKSVQSTSTTGLYIPPHRAALEKKCAGWFYVGSANFTESAWGTVVSKRATAKFKSGVYVSMRNWELGVVCVMETEEEMEAMAEFANAQGLNPGGEQSFFGPLPIPYKRPLTQYTATDRPWIR
ncbi:hypothetical protein BX616_009069 [Lobosporangium transversale]|uniref:Tyrosyl-DNA phosphodiesterase-domain-containing protein n=1 Tax=Lobosporangium transversale TaxID=64571 RepID=A0A1Y2GEV2_9FUNG|nr:tyrosyl-DNA phosphodiesterase-domain-containing protein [Lobosporangium transversale]KAF9918387.1 hypothetical protein BX616_009069 [Lobosporangium transversale]ORZ07978.1 tyrosyl-DNA phosphodiesterase-domain-containing protein [Lobosporangium transversale]|eukprot:XP_021878212.1 tyrosyl-DNA phosphodiesterase-domain-containing protein [Lobosporangium transversale]